MIDFKELKGLLDKATPRPWKTIEPEIEAIQPDRPDDPHKRWTFMPEDIELCCVLVNNAKELLRLAEIGRKYKEHDEFLMSMDYD